MLGRAAIARRIIGGRPLVAVCHFGASGFGCGIVDPFTAYAARHSALAFRPLEPALDLEHGVLWERDHALSAALVAMCGHLTSTAERVVNRELG